MGPRQDLTAGGLLHTRSRESGLAAEFLHWFSPSRWPSVRAGHRDPEAAYLVEAETFRERSFQAWAEDQPDQERPSRSWGLRARKTVLATQGQGRTTAIGSKFPILGPGIPALYRHAGDPNTMDVNGQWTPGSFPPPINSTVSPP